MKQMEKTKLGKTLLLSALGFLAACFLAAMLLGLLVMREVVTPELAGMVLKGITLAALFILCFFLARQSAGRRLLIALAVVCAACAAGLMTRVLFWNSYPFGWRWLATAFVTGVAAGLFASRKQVRRR